MRIVIFGGFGFFPGRTLDIYRAFRKPSVFIMLLEHEHFFRYVKPDLLDIHRPFDVYTENRPPKKVVTSKCTYVRLALFDQ